MKKAVVWLISFLMSGTMVMAQGQLDFNSPSILDKTYTRAEVTSNHSVSLTILGLEYAYERVLDGNWTLVMRAGFPCVMTSGYSQEITNSTTISSGGVSTTNSSTSKNYNFNYGPRPGVSLEPRYYTNFHRRYDKGKNTVNNSADFASIQIKLFTPNFEGFGITLIPTYGIRRGGEHWFREYTAGIAIHTMTFYFAPVLPHLGFRIGYTF